ncbi:MAG TPA: SRPBCC domain-containing protein [Flavisolibacter sp.]|nr:SRPBCC domain-containing protein [Flavisolibacter sp.]
MQNKIVRHEIDIHVPASALWRILTCPQHMRQFLFNGEHLSDWKEGSMIMAYKKQSGEIRLIARGRVEEVVPGQRLRLSFFEVDSFSAEPLCLCYELWPAFDATKLMLAVELRPTCADAMMEESRMMLQKIKWLAEFGESGLTK